MVVLIATGTDMAGDRLGSFGDLFDTDYGERLLAKLVLVAVVIALTLFHTLVQGPALSGCARRRSPTPTTRICAARSAANPPRPASSLRSTCWPRSRSWCSRPGS